MRLPAFLPVVTAAFIRVAAASAQAAPVPPRPSPGAVFVTLGTGGGPVIRRERSEPANAVVVNGAVYLFDAGDGVQRQLATFQLPPARLRAVFVSHHHVDHDAGLVPLLYTRWALSQARPLPVLGPPGTVEMLAEAGRAFRPTELAPLTVGGPPPPPFAATVAARDFPSSTPDPVVVYQDENLRVLAITNTHYHAPPGSEAARTARSYAFRIEAPGRVMVFTGDTGPSRNVERLARGADLLVSEVIDLPRQEAESRRTPGLPPAALAGLLAHFEQDHLTPEQVGRLAAAAGVKQVVLTHLSPGNDGETDLSGYTAGIDRAFRGKVVVARDGDRF